MVDTQDLEQKHYTTFLADIAAQDAQLVKKRDERYGGSWCKRGGAGAYFATIRKVDRIEEGVIPFHHDVFAAVRAGLEGDEGMGDGILADIRDLRRYLLLWEAYLVAEGTITAPKSGRMTCDTRNIRHSGEVDICVLNEGHQGAHVTGDGVEFSILMPGDPILSFRPKRMSEWPAAGLAGLCNFPIPVGIGGKVACQRAHGHEGDHHWRSDEAGSDDPHDGLEVFDFCVLLANHSGNHRWESEADPVGEKPREPRCKAGRSIYR